MNFSSPISVYNTKSLRNLKIRNSNCESNETFHNFFPYLGMDMDQCEFLMHFSYNFTFRTCVVGFHSAQRMKKNEEGCTSRAIYNQLHRPFEKTLIIINRRVNFSFWGSQFSTSQNCNYIQILDQTVALTNYDKFPLTVKMKGLDLGHSTDHLLPRRLFLFRLQKEVTKTASGNKNTANSEKKRFGY